MTVAGTLFVAFTAFRLAYAGSKGAAMDAGLSPADAAWYPLCIEGVLVVAAVATVVLGGRYPWAVLVGFSGLSIGANVMHAADQPGPAGWFNLLVAAVPPAALPLCVELTIRTVSRIWPPVHEPPETPPVRHPGETPALTLVTHLSETPPGPAGETPGEATAAAAHDTDETPPPPATETPRRRRVSPARKARGGASAAVYDCDAGCGRAVSRATRGRHRRDGCPR